MDTTDEEEYEHVIMMAMLASPDPTNTELQMWRVLRQAAQLDTCKNTIQSLLLGAIHRIKLCAADDMIICAFGFDDGSVHARLFQRRDWTYFSIFRVFGQVMGCISESEVLRALVSAHSCCGANSECNNWGWITLLCMERHNNDRKLTGFASTSLTPMEPEAVESRFELLMEYMRSKEPTNSDLT